jgi:peroxiredoxin Q/BCP
MTEKLEPGQKAPEFNLLDQDGNSFTSSSLNGGKAIVYFYPAAATPGCTTQACDFRDNLNVLKALGYSVVGISPDKPEKLKKFIEKEGLNFPLLSDPENEVQKAFGAHGLKKMYGKEYEGTIRSTFALDESGVISHAFYNVKAKGHFDYLRKHMGL